MTTQAWVEEELRDADLGDARLDRRLRRMVSDFAEHPESSVPEASGDWAGTKGAYRLWDNDRVESHKIVEAHQKRTQERMQGLEVVLAIQDTPNLDYSDHPKKQEGMGHLDHPRQIGLKQHSVLAVDPEGVPLGLLHQAWWTREEEENGKKPQRRSKETSEKESQRWLDGAQAAATAVPEGTQVVVIGDRESDLYELAALELPENCFLLVRAAQRRRRVDHEARYLLDAVEQAPVAGELTLPVPRKRGTPPREATLTLRFCTVQMLPPRHALQRAQKEPVTVQVILAQEENPPKGEKPLLGLLWTTLPVTSLEDAVRCTRWYALRWLIERFHFVLKSGCQMEQLQLETADRMQRAAATLSLVAWRLLGLTYEARVHADQPCDLVLQTHEWQALYCEIHDTPIPPPTPPTLQHAVLGIARLGGFLARKRDGQPGVKVLRRGLRRLHDIARTYRLHTAHATPDAAPNPADLPSSLAALDTS